MSFSSFQRAALKSATVLFAMVALVSISYGQATTQSITGLVTDSTGAAVVGAKVTITNKDTGVSQTVTANDSGNYIFVQVAVGTYEVKCEVTGFKAEVVSNMRVETAAQVRRDFTLEVGAVTETIEVAAAGVQLNTENAVVGHVIENKRIIELPLNGRNIVQLAVLVAGVQFGSRTGLADGLGGQVMTGNTYSVTANGQREIHQVVSLDGVDAKDPRVHVAPFVPSIEAVEEFKIQTNAYSAEVGFGGGAVTTITTKSGTNALHGTVFEFLRNDKTDAEDYFLNFELAPGIARRQKNARRRNQFGAVVSGPVIKNKTFWAANWESRREVLREYREGFFPLDEFRGGDFSALARGTINPATGRLYRAPIILFDPLSGEPFANNRLPASRLHPGIVNNVIPKFLPRAEFRPVDPLDINVRRLVPRTINPNFYFGRFDHYFSGTDRVFARIAVDQSSARNGNLTLNPEFQNTQKTRGRNLATSWIRTINSSTVNDVRVGFSFAGYNNANDRQGGTFDNDSLGIGAFRVFNDGNRKFNNLENGIPGLGFTIGDGGEFNQLDTWQFGDYLSKIHGNHTFKMGAEFYLVRIERAAANIPNGSVGWSANQSGYDFASFLLGYPNSTTTAEGWPYTFPHATRQGYYFNDDWKVTPRLTINMGLRFDYNGNPVDVRGLQRALDFPGAKTFDNGRGKGYRAPDGTILPIMFPDTADEKAAVKLWDQQVRFFMPRLGIAYRPREKWVVRIGAGWFDNLNHQNNWTILNLNPPKSGTLDFQSTTDVAQTFSVTGADGASYPITTRRFRPGLPILTLNDPFLANQGGSPAARGAQNLLSVAPDTRDGSVWKWSFDIQRELPFTLLAKVGYVGSKGSNTGYSSNNYNDARPSSNTDINSRRRWTRYYDPTQPQYGIQNLGNVRYLDAFGESFHHGLQVTLDKRYSNGLAMGIAYTYSKSHGDGENGGNEGNNFQDPFDRRPNRGRYRFDQTHNFVAHYVYEFPGRNLKGAMGYLLGGWQSNGIVSIRSGFPFSATQGGDLNTGNGQVRPDRIADGEISNPTRALWFNPQAFTRVTCNNPARPDLCRFGTAGYNILESPGQRNIDFSLFKNFSFAERYSLQFRSEFFNALNTPYFGQPNGIGFSSANVVVPDAARMGEVRSLRTPMRIIQFGLKFFF
ncbi:MAG: TonB-dependent receptor domain-containing protein [Bryobacteraceae bacterium]